MKTNQIIDYYFEAVRIRDIQRYGHLIKKFRNNVAEHCFMMIVLADKLIEHYKLALDFRKVVRYIYIHDWGAFPRNPAMVFDYNGKRYCKTDDGFRELVTWVNKAGSESAGFARIENPADETVLEQYYNQLLKETTKSTDKDPERM